MKELRTYLVVCPDYIKGPMTKDETEKFLVWLVGHPGCKYPHTVVEATPELLAKARR